MTDEPPLEMYVAVETYQPAETDDPITHVFNYPFETREGAEREAEGMREALESDGTPKMDWYHVEVQSILVPPGRDYEQMDADTHESLREAAGAVGEGLFAAELSDDGSDPR